MRYVKYIKEHKVWLIIFTIFLCSLEMFLMTFSDSGWLMLYVAIAGIIGLFLGTYLDYRRWRYYFDKLESLIETLDKKYLLPELMDDSEYQEEKIIKDVLCDMEVSMNERVSSYRRSSQEYKEYIETWVHEIKIPISAMKMILVNHKDMDFGLENEISRIEGYVEQVLFYARSNDVGKDYLINELNIKNIVQEVIQKRRNTLRRINAKIDLHDLDVMVHSDSKWLLFMFGQIIENSIKYSDKETLSLEIYSEKHDNSILLRIKDNGTGIKESELSRVFDKGFTGSNGRATANSTGIGLYLCKKLCDRLEHNIVIDSKIGEGTIVTFVFPVSDMITMK